MPAADAPDGSPTRGYFVAFEGGDGAGKSTQMRLTSQWLIEQGHSVLLSREPGGTELGQAIRQLVLHGDYVAPRAEALLFAADRAHHAETVIRPGLDRGAVVMTDRYLDSSVAYQGVARDLSGKDVRDLSLWATQGLLPDLTILLDVTPDQGRLRRGNQHDRLEREADGFHAAVRQGFLGLAQSEPARYLVLPAHESKTALQERIRTELSQRLAVVSR